MTERQLDSVVLCFFSYLFIFIFSYLMFVARGWGGEGCGGLFECYIQSVRDRNITKLDVSLIPGECELAWNESVHK